MPLGKEEILIDCLDSTLLDPASPAPAEFRQHDPEMADLWRTLLMTVEIVREAGLNERVRAARNQFAREKAIAGKSRPVVRSLNYRSALRIAAAILLVAGASILYKYNSTSPGSNFSKYYEGYDLGTRRGQAGMRSWYRHTGKKIGLPLSTWKMNRKKMIKMHCFFPAWPIWN